MTGSASRKRWKMRLIDADALITELNGSHFPGAPYVDAGISIAIGKVCDAPTIEPERKRGKWKPFDLTWGRSIYACTACQTGLEVPTEMGKPMYNYCPYCGADMREDGEQDGKSEICV